MFWLLRDSCILRLENFFFFLARIVKTSFYFIRPLTLMCIPNKQTKNKQGHQSKQIRLLSDSRGRTDWPRSSLVISVLSSPLPLVSRDCSHRGLGRSWLGPSGPSDDD